jgi:hypothetical protein
MRKLIEKTMCSVLISKSWENFEDTKGLSEALNREIDNTIAKPKKKPKGQTMIYKHLFRILKIEQHEQHLKLKVDSVALEEWAVPAPLVASFVLLLLSSLW